MKEKEYSVMECQPIGQLSATQFCIELGRNLVRVIILLKSMAKEHSSSNLKE